MHGILLTMRTLFVIIIASLGYQIAVIFSGHPIFNLVNVSGILFGALFAIGVIWAEMEYSTRFISGIFAIFWGLLVGFISSYLFIQTLFLIPHFKLLSSDLPANHFTQILETLKVGITVFFCYLSVMLIFKTRDNFRLFIPFVHLSPKDTSQRPLILDTSVIIDGRIGTICDTNIFSGPIVLPRFVLQEIQNIADSADKQKRNRGRRGLDILNDLQQKKKAQIEIVEEVFPHLREVDSKLVALAQKLHGVILTNDYNLKRIAQLQDTPTINLNELANALRPMVLPGETLEVKLVKAGEEPDQGIGYMEDGTVVIVSNGRKQIGRTVTVSITNVLQTNIGRMIFGKTDSPA